MSATASLTEDLRLIASTSASRWPAVSSPSCSTSAWKSLASTMVLLAANQLQGTSHYFMSEQSQSEWVRAVRRGDGHVIRDRSRLISLDCTFSCLDVTRLAQPGGYTMSVIWEACAGKKWCVHIPFDGEKCLEAQACVRVLEEGGNFYFEVQIGGEHARIPLGNSCAEARYYVFAAKACIANLNITAHSINFDIVLRLCIDANIGPIHIGECVDVYQQHIAFGLFNVN